jgi:predicted secreted protein
MDMKTIKINEVEYEIIKDESLWEKSEKKVDKFNAKTKAEKREVIEEASIKILEGRVALFNNVEQKNE